MNTWFLWDPLEPEALRRISFTSLVSEGILILMIQLFMSSNFEVQSSSRSWCWVWGGERRSGDGWASEGATSWPLCVCGGGRVRWTIALFFFLLVKHTIDLKKGSKPRLVNQVPVTRVSTWWLPGNHQSLCMNKYFRQALSDKEVSPSNRQQLLTDGSWSARFIW